jgi:hypothetical protein
LTNKEVKAINTEILYLNEFRGKFLLPESEGYRKSLQYEIELFKEKEKLLSEQETSVEIRGNKNNGLIATLHKDEWAVNPEQQKKLLNYISKLGKNAANAINDDLEAYKKRMDLLDNEEEKFDNNIHREEDRINANVRKYDETYKYNNSRLQTNKYLDEINQSLKVLISAYRNK